ncbi:MULTISPECIES: DUF2778 domain-containing protein [Lelliottia]|uniref:DUF2778 domain-containing protein n=1 Tax=Lelliottia wanjuensis TaxID=3050585 RepID=A0AAP4D0E8_9ENTR|nr:MULTISPECIES: DUF2778 domain-containing protein [unclassified Lelliottia]MDK9362799.1 DUF2778 domain-containing protein [Lelliottia sp. V106_12]MDK9583306.1 DUF2778 domain-containing protein [Lelliottia sp. V86_10]MDK9615183.1 DUF2778 domain-containing protein [Lelliottia sp. V106_9]
MIRCTFRLNGNGLSNLSCPGIGFFPAYSGNEGQHRNNPASVAVKGAGPLPPGQYYIVDRPRSIGTRVKDVFATKYTGSDHSIWFALYRVDGSIDDHTFIEAVERGNFRLHPAGYEGISNGCITLPSPSHFLILRDALMKTPKLLVSGSLYAYGTVQVY